MRLSIILLLILAFPAFSDTDDELDYAMEQITNDVNTIENVIQSQTDTIDKLRNNILIISIGREKAEDSLELLEKSTNELRQAHYDLKLRYEKRESRYRRILVRERSRIFTPIALAASAYMLAPSKKVEWASSAFLAGSIAEYGFNVGLSKGLANFYFSFKREF